MRLQRLLNVHLTLQLSRFVSLCFPFTLECLALLPFIPISLPMTITYTIGRCHRYSRAVLDALPL
jgi:hypothetical protein